MTTISALDLPVFLSFLGVCYACSEVWMFEEEVQHKGVKRKLSEVFNETKVAG